MEIDDLIFAIVFAIYVIYRLIFIVVIQASIFTGIYLCTEKLIRFIVEKLEEHFARQHRQEVRRLQTRIRELRREVIYFQNQNQYIRELQDGLRRHI